jgi:perosamine synthetase
MSSQPITIPVSRPFFWGKESQYVVEAIEEGWISSKGRFLTELERRFAEWAGVRHAIATTSGTTALHLALVAAGVQAGDEVIVPDFCMVAPIFALRYCGAIPVLVDADATWNIDVDQVDAQVTDRTRAILAVHTYGHPARMSALRALADRRGLLLIEDAAEAIGSAENGVRAGTIGDVACFSLYANKIITSGEGGILVTGDDAIAERARWHRDMCFGREPERRFVHEAIGFNYRMTNVQAAIAVAQLEHVDEAIAAKIAVAERYSDLLRDVRGLTLPPHESWATHSYWVYGVLVDPAELGADGARVRSELAAQGIETRRFFEPAHRQPFLHCARQDAEFPVSSALADRGFYLPSFIGMCEDDQARVAKALLATRGRP